MQEGFPFYLMIGIRYTVTAAAAAHCNHTRYDIFIEVDATIGLGLRRHTAEAEARHRPFQYGSVDNGSNPAADG